MQIQAVPYVWAANKNGKLEKRSVILGQYDEELGEYEIADGLTKDDSIAFPSDVLEEGMATTTNIDEAMDTGSVDMQPVDELGADNLDSEDAEPLRILLILKMTGMRMTGASMMKMRISKMNMSQTVTAQ